VLFVLSCDKREKTLDSVPSQYISVDGFNIHFKEYGKGDKTLIFIHGWGCDLNIWEYQFDYFKDKYHLVLIDLPGYGQSDKTANQYTIDFFAQSVLEVVGGLEIKSPILIAHSMGLPVAIEVLKKMDGQNVNLCNIDGVYLDFPKDSVENQQYIERLNEFTQMFTGEDYQKNVLQFCKSFISETTPPYVSEYILSTMTKTSEIIGFQSMASLIDKKYWRSEKIINKTIAIYAKIADLPPDNERILRKQFPNLTYIEMAGVNHFLMMEKPIEVNEILMAFIEQ
jgi:pimeloyl-ACP methyl ester carboxylesterase